MSKILRLLGTLLLAGSATGAFSQEAISREVIPKEAIAVGPTALSTLRELVGRLKNSSEMGFASVDELNKATLGDPFSIFTIQLDELGAYRDGQDPGALLHRRTQLLFPVVVGGQVRSSITMGSSPAGWAAVAFGGPAKIRLLASVRATSIETTKLAPADYFSVEIPGLKLVFIGHRNQGVLMLTPVLDYPSFHLKAGTAMRAADVYAATRMAVKSHMEAPG